MSTPDPPKQQPPATRHNHLTTFLTGLTLLTLSTLLTRRSLLHRHRSITPHFYHPSNAQPLIKINGRLEAYQALGLATMNVASVFVMVGGGLLWAFDVGGMEDFKRRVGRRRRGGGGMGERGEEGEGEEEEFEKWVGSMMGGKEGGERRRRWSAREANREEEERAREERFTVVVEEEKEEEERQATNGRGKPR